MLQDIVSVIAVIFLQPLSLKQSLAILLIFAETVFFDHIW